MIRHFILEGLEVKEVDVSTHEGLIAWAVWFEEHHKERIVAQEQVGNVLVSTVFLGIDHEWDNRRPPLIFETIAFGLEKEQWSDRYSTFAEAMIGHAGTVARIKHQEVQS